MSSGIYLDNASGAALRERYLHGVRERRSSLDLDAELLDVRADALCVCPTRLGES